ncbi:MAG: hypothetical protein M8353_10735 [ANME-2 cluster archaeon]|nr:hypothetical protein [ANME-2 cluster archaeon]
MVKILHVIKEHGDTIALDIIKAQGKIRNLAVLLIHDGVLDHDLVVPGITIYAARADIEARGIETDIVLLDYSEIVDMIFGSNRVICW